MTVTTLPALKTVAEALSYLQVNRDELDALITSGQLPAYQFPEDGYRFNPVDLQACKRAMYVAMFEPCALY